MGAERELNEQEKKLIRAALGKYRDKILFSTVVNKVVIQKKQKKVKGNTPIIVLV
jgi:hypothetical protein